MALEKEQYAQLQATLKTAQNPDGIVKAAKMLDYQISDEDAAALFTEIQSSKEPEGKILDEGLKVVNGGITTDQIPQYQEIREYYKTKGPNFAFTLCIYYIPSPFCYDVIEYIEKNDNPTK